MWVAAASDSRMASRTTVRTRFSVERAPLHAVLQLHDGDRVGVHGVGFAVRDGKSVPEAGRVVCLAAPDRLLHVARPVGASGAVEEVGRRLDCLFLRAAVHADAHQFGVGQRQRAPGRALVDQLLDVAGRWRVKGALHQGTARGGRQPAEQSLRRRNLRRQHAELVEAETDQHRQEAGPPSHVAAEPHPAPAGVGLRDDAIEETEE